MNLLHFLLFNHFLSFILLIKNKLFSEFKLLSFGYFFFRLTQTLCSDCALIISDVGKRFFAFNRKRNIENSVRAIFLDFVT